MAKGRAADPTRAERKTGHRPRGDEAKAVPELPAVQVATVNVALQPPASLPVAAHELWTRAIDELVALRTLHESDLPIVEMMVTAAYRNRQARAQVESTGMLVRGVNGPMLNPLLKVEKDTASTYQRLAETLGLTPVARLRLGLMRIAGETMLQSMNDRLVAEVAARTAIGR